MVRRMLYMQAGRFFQQNTLADHELRGPLHEFLIQQELLAFYAKVGLFAVQWMENEDPSRVATVGHEPVIPDMEISVAQVGRRAHEAPAQMQFPGLHKVQRDLGDLRSAVVVEAVAPPAEDGRSFKFNKRIASGSFDPALKRKPQSRQFSSREDLAPKVPQANEESNEVNQTVETPEKKDTTMQSSWI
ncbi:unnamed protein product [Cladocopium goreaui]|uniref:Uncharacterized protein n=1 Tax=Cladocopium goreaui TaxID=2562237 RepID=A0A9P1M322_9DINO|nr:unnamed protein product [Cladocopium goreaui]